MSTARASTVSAVRLAAHLGLPEPTPEQAAVIESPLEPAVVIAGAGSGKTETMAARVVWLVANRLVAPDAVLGLTFTRKAAGELGARIRRRLAQWRHVVERETPEDVELLAALRAGEPTVATYAAYAGRLVAEQGLRLGVEPDARLLSPAQCWQLADAAVRAHPGPLPAGVGTPASIVGWVLTMAGQCADHLVDADDLEEFCAGLLEHTESVLARGKIRKTGPVADFTTALRHRQALLAIVRDFAAAKAALPAVDFGDQMTAAARLAELPEVRAGERDRYRTVLLDEYQDTGHAQIRMLHGLFGRGHAVTAVGDPLQSIYGWRGASAGNIKAFADLFARAEGTPARVYPLATSFRNDRAVLQAANTVAAGLRRGASALALRPRADAGAGTIELARTETYLDEATWVAARMREHWDARPAGARTAAVLVRRRAQIPVLAEALHDVGLPVEVVGLGGLLTTPEVADVVATLRVLADHEAAPALGRLLTGARWRIGPRDLAVLAGRARGLGDGTDPVTVVEALDDLGPPQRYSPVGYARLSALADELRGLRRRVGGPLPDLVAAIERVTGVRVEVAARADRNGLGRVHLDRFADEVADFAAEATDARGATLGAFLAYLAAAEQEENGLEAGEASVATERVQILTVHAAKGLEWDVVAVPGLVEGTFPAAPRGVNWTRARHELPIPLRGDRADLPELELDPAADPDELARALTDHDQALKRRHAREERRLAYVAFTRARSALLASGYVWDGNVAPHEPSVFLDELRDAAGTDGTDGTDGWDPPVVWFEPAADAPNPVTAAKRTGTWPADPLGARRDDVEAGAELVRAATGRAPGSEPTSAPVGAVPAATPVSGRASQWAGDVDRLLAERAAIRGGDTIEVELPAQLSVSQLVQLERDPAELARRIRRPLPSAPAPLARRGTRFHAWLEQRWQAQPLLDVDELPGAADAASGDAREQEDFDALCAAFEASGWSRRRPAEVEVPFEMAIGGTVLRGRMDAVFATGADPGEEHWTVVDWKTGTRPDGAAADAAAIQLAAYRLAWARLVGLPDDELHRVRAAFHYVRSGETVEPVALLDAAGLRQLITGSAEHNADASAVHS